MVILKVCFRRDGKEFEIQITEGLPLLFQMRNGEHCASYQLDESETRKLKEFLSMYDGGKPDLITAPLPPEADESESKEDKLINNVHELLDSKEPVHLIRREDLTTRAYHTILKLHVSNWEHLAKLDDSIFKGKNCGQKTINELRLKQKEILEAN